MSARTLLPAALALSLSTFGCSGGGVEIARVRNPAAEALRADGARTDTKAVMAATAGLLASGGQTALHGGRERFIATSPLGFELNVHAGATLRTLALESGAGAHLMWSTRTVRMAASPGAPADANRNGTNHDEVLAAEWQQFEQLTGGQTPANAWPSFALYREADPHFDAPPDVARREQDYATLRWNRDKVRVGFVLEELGFEAFAKVQRAASLLQRYRGSAPGRTATEGIEGLQLLQQALALEEFLAAELVYDKDAQLLGPLPDPAPYDPEHDLTTDLRWFPVTVSAQELPQANGLPPQAGGFQAIDPSSDLMTQAALLLGFSELAWLASPSQPDGNLAALFAGRPFGPPARSDRDFESSGGAPSGDPPQADQITYRTHIAGLMMRRFCNSCHPTGGGSGGFISDTYEDILRGGNHRLTNPTVVPGDAANSLLWRVLALANPTPTIRMPQGGPYLPQADIDLVRDWINQGAKKNPDVVLTAPTIPGRSMVRVIVRNLRAMHLDPQHQVLVDNHDRHSRSAHVDGATAGWALAALALALEAIPKEIGLPELLGAEADFVSSTLVGTDGAVHVGFTLGVGPDDRPAALEAQAAVVYGLLETFRRTGQQRHLNAALRAGNFLLTRFWDPGQSLFASQLGQRTRVYEGRAIAALTAALRDLANVGAADAAAVHDRFGFKVFRGPMMLAEWQETGEVVGDGIPDTNRNGVPEVPMAGGPFGVATVFASRLLEGPPPDTETFPGVVSWSRHIKPLFRGACGQCHFNGAHEVPVPPPPKLKGGNYNLEFWETAFTQGVSRDTLGPFPMIVPGAPEQSLLYLKITQRVPPVGIQMPEAQPPLSNPARALVAAWIRQGALNN